MGKFNQEDVRIEKLFIGFHFMRSSMAVIDKARKEVAKKFLEDLGRTAFRRHGKTEMTSFHFMDSFNQLYPPITFEWNTPPKTVRLIPTTVKGNFTVIVPDTFFL